MREQSSRFSVTMKCSFHNLSILLIILCVPGQIFSYDLNTVISKVSQNKFHKKVGKIRENVMVLRFLCCLTALIWREKLWTFFTWKKNRENATVLRFLTIDYFDLMSKIVEIL